jgi:hypothetical protein
MQEMCYERVSLTCCAQLCLQAPSLLSSFSVDTTLRPRSQFLQQVTGVPMEELGSVFSRYGTARTPLRSARLRV